MSPTTRSLSRKSLIALFFSVTIAAAFIITYKASDYARYWVNDIVVSRNIQAVAMGSSSIRSLPLDLFDQCPGLVRRGFGGGTLGHLSLYLDYSFLPADLNWVLLYAGENDIVYGTSVESAIHQFNVLSDRLTERFPEARVVIIKPKLAPARSDFHAKLRLLNERLDSLESHPKIMVIDSPLADEVLPKYYLADGVHLTREGYQVFLQEAPKEC